MKSTVEVVPLRRCIVWVNVCYHVIVAPYVRSVGHVFAYLYSRDDDLERHMDYETYLLSNVFPTIEHVNVSIYQQMCMNDMLLQ